MIFNFFRYECYCQPGYYGVNCQIPPTTLCPTDEGNYLEIDGQCFYFETQNLGYPEAKANCAKNKFSGGGRLFEPMTLAENEKICKTFADLLGKLQKNPVSLLICTLRSDFLKVAEKRFCNLKKGGFIV